MVAHVVAPARRLLLAFLLLAALLPTVAPRPVGAAPDCKIPANGATGGDELRAALAYAGCPTITFAAGVTEVTVATRLEIARDVTVQGPGVTVRYTGAASSAGSVFAVHKGTVTLTGLTITGGRTSGWWGAGLTTTGDGGATTITLDGVTVTGNAATNAGGGGIYASNATLTLTNSTVSANTADNPTLDSFNYGGGGIFLDNFYGGIQATVVNSTISGNTAPHGFGGGLILWHRATGPATLTLSGSTIDSNGAVVGGGLSLAGGTATVTNSTISGNSTNGSGGGFYVTDGVLAVTNSTIGGNVAGYEGGGFYLDGLSTTTLTNDTISNNIAAGGGGGVVINDPTASARLRFVTLTGNAATTGGGGIYWVHGSIIVLSSIVAGNRRGAGTPDDCVGTIISQGRNIWGDTNPCPNNVAADDQSLAALNTGIASVLNPTLADNGGPTRTHNLVAGSPAIDRGDNVACPATDQRGVARPQGAGCDIGAVEYTAPAASPSPSPSPSVSPSPSASPSPSPSSGPVPSFADVPVGYWAHDQIGTFARRGITTGCDADAQGNKYYCPERGVTRAEMGVFLDRTRGYGTPPTPASPRFTDVPASYWAYAFIDTFATLGITTGCGGTEFCPDRGVTRAEMAAFLIRALGKPQRTPAAPTFADVPASHPQYGYIEALVNAGVTTGCGTNDAGQRVYCPDRGVTRAEMAVFIIRAFP